MTISLRVPYFAQRCSKIRLTPCSIITPFQHSNTTFCYAPRVIPSPQGRRYASSDYLPTILQPRFWRILVPKAWRSDAHAEGHVASTKSKEWNPATFFIVIFLLIGSQAIQLIALQRDCVAFSNKTEAKLSLLRDVVKRVQAGEDVDVEVMLGTGDKAKEKEWEEVLRELEEEDVLIQSRREKQLAKKAAKDADKGKGTP